MRQILSMKKLLVYALVASVILFIIIVVPFRSSPPAPTVKAGHTTVKTTEGSYCWSGFTSSECVDKAYTSIEDMAEEHTPTAVAREETISLHFKDAPTVAISETIDGKSSDIPLTNNQFNAPKTSGTYIYSIRADWERGSGFYVFSVHVK